MEKTERILEAIQNYFQMKKDIFQMDIVREDGKKVEWIKR